MLLLELGSELPNLVKKFQSIPKIWTKSRLNFYEVGIFPLSGMHNPYQLQMKLSNIRFRPKVNMQNALHKK